MWRRVVWQIGGDVSYEPSVSVFGVEDTMLHSLSLFCPEDGGRKFLWNVGTHIPTTRRRIQEDGNSKYCFTKRSRCLIVLETYRSGLRFPRRRLDYDTIQSGRWILNFSEETSASDISWTKYRTTRSHPRISQYECESCPVTRWIALILICRYSSRFRWWHRWRQLMSFNDAPETPGR
jgi:hypothetical protein